MEKVSQEIVIPKNKERFQQLKQLRDNLEKTNIPTNVISKFLQDLLVFPDITAKEINNLNISKILKKFLENGDRDIRSLTNDLIRKWKKITKEAAEVNKKTNISSDFVKQEISQIKTEIINSELIDKNEPSVKRIEIYNKKIEDIKKTFNTNIKYLGLPNLRKTTMILLLESIAKISKEKLLSDEKKDKENDNSDKLKSIEIAISRLDFIKETSEQIEGNLNNLFEDSKEKYIRRAKSIISNLRINDDLYQGLFEEKITPVDLVKMDEKDMASKEIKILRQKKEEESFNARRSDWDRLHNTFVSGMYKCGKCKQTKTTYHQAQIRRADEPMTTFVSCLNCNHSWKC